MSDAKTRLVGQDFTAQLSLAVPGLGGLTCIDLYGSCVADLVCIVLGKGAGCQGKYRSKLSDRAAPPQKKSGAGQTSCRPARPPACGDAGVWGKGELA